MSGVAKKLAASMLFTICGCGAEAFQKNATAISTGCPRDDVELVSDESVSGQSRWDAHCGGRTYHCEGTTLSDTSCLSDPPQPALRSVRDAANGAGSPPLRREWTRFLAKECAASVLLPGRPAEKREAINTAAGATSVYSATVGTDEQSVVVTCITLPAKATLNAGQIFDGARDRMLRSSGWTLESEHDLELGDGAARDLRFDAHGDKGKARLILRGRTVATLLIGPLRDFSSEEVEAFVDSFKAVQTAADR